MKRGNRKEIIGATMLLLCAGISAISGAQSYRYREQVDELSRLNEALNTLCAAKQAEWLSGFRFTSAGTVYDTWLEVRQALDDQNVRNELEYPEAGENDVYVRILKHDNFVPRAFAPLFQRRQLTSDLIPLRALALRYDPSNPNLLLLTTARPAHTEWTYGATETSREGDKMGALFESRFEIYGSDALAIQKLARSLRRLKRLSAPGVGEDNPVPPDNAPVASMDDPESSEFRQPLPSVTRNRIDSNKLPEELSGHRKLFESKLGTSSETILAEFGKPDRVIEQDSTLRWHYRRLSEASASGQTWKEFGETVFVFNNNRLVEVRFSPTLRSRGRVIESELPVYVGKDEVNPALPIAFNWDRSKRWPIMEAYDYSWTYDHEADRRSLIFFSGRLGTGYCTILAGAQSSLGLYKNYSQFQADSDVYPHYTFDPLTVTVSKFDAAQNGDVDTQLLNPLFDHRRLRVVTITFSKEPPAVKVGDSVIAYENWPLAKEQRK